MRKKKHLSNDAAVFQWITSCHKISKTTRVLTLRWVNVMSLITAVSTMHFLIEILKRGLNPNVKRHTITGI